jgi:DNA repair protein RecO (recombination protein O)
VALLDDDALVLDSLAYGELHLILSLLTPSSGVVRAVLRGARGGKHPPAAATQLLSLIHVVVFQGRRAELATVRQVDLKVSSFPLAGDLERSAATAVVAELLTTFCPQGEPAPRPFRLGVAALNALLGGTAPATVVAYTQLWILTLSGLMPPLEDCAEIADDLEFLVTCRTLAPSELPRLPSAELVRWLDRQVRREADRPLRALDFLRTSGA